MIKETKKWKNRYFLLLLWPIAGSILLLARHTKEFAEAVFAQRLYRVYHTAIARLTGALSFSLGEWLLYGFVIGLVLMLVLWCVHIIKGKGHRGYIIFQGCMDGLCLLGVIFFLFVFGCGANYYRDSYAQCSGLQTELSTQEELCALCQCLAQRADVLREELRQYENSSGVFTLPCTLEDLGNAAAAAMTKLGEQEPVLKGFYPQPKQVMWSKGMSCCGITGIYFPFTVEANVNVDVADFTIGATMCHELSHVAGFMREGEANYLAYHACTCSENPILDYSGTMLALIYVENALYHASPERYWQVRSTYGEGMNRDLAADSAYWEQFEDTIANEIGESVNDAYLRANNQENGIQSYGDMVDLLLAEYRKAQKA